MAVHAVFVFLGQLTVALSLFSPFCLSSRSLSDGQSSRAVSRGVFPRLMPHGRSLRALARLSNEPQMSAIRACLEVASSLSPPYAGVPSRVNSHMHD